VKEENINTIEAIQNSDNEMEKPPSKRLKLWQMHQNFYKASPIFFSIFQYLL
jgi:hypothetical protein